ncbi:tRNA-binding protein [Pontibacter sp. MBLB2868]|uniref:tRNA-binding protein n=1 Tax=Pontibacter sp. MBLB2868 TaxID=3451555 RepID=UPI003F7502D8
MEYKSKHLLNWKDFTNVDMRVGTITEAVVFEEARKPAYKLLVDFGELGVLKTSAQITKRYTPERLVGKQVVAVVNFPPKQIANIMSECLILGTMGDDNEVVLLQPEMKIKNGLRIS